MDRSSRSTGGSDLRKGLRKESIGVSGESAATTAFVALGANLGNSRDTVNKAIERLQEFSAKPLLVSSLWRTTPVDCPAGSPEFINAVVGLVPLPGETPESFLAKLADLEREFGRGPRSVRNEARPLDLDIIAFGGLTRQSPELILPHPRAHQRRFVLAPLAEIAPDLILPGQAHTVSELLNALPSSDEVCVRES